jgi:hypothetical protein
MPIRSLKLKLLLKRDQDSSSLRQNIWLTHDIVNAAVIEFERILLLCRGSGYQTGEGQPISAEVVQAKALEWARQVQQKNRMPNAGSDSELLDTLRKFYEELVPSIRLNEKGEPLDGDAQAANAFASPMMDASSEGFQSIFSKILDPMPEWVSAMQKDQTGWLESSITWLQTPEAQQLQKASGSPPRWVRRLKQDQSWQEEFIADQQKKATEIKGIPTLIHHMRVDLGLLPMLAPPITSCFADGRTGLTPWDRLAFRLAVAHLLSWESWNHRAQKEHQQVKVRLEQQASKLASYGDMVEKLRVYETERHEELKKTTALADDRRIFRIGIRATRSWDRVVEAWEKTGITKQKRIEALSELQNKLGRQFGDPDLYRWLAEEGREPLWQCPELLPAIARFNAIERLIGRKKEQALYTPPDARNHPRWLMYEATGGSNLKTYELCSNQGILVLHLPCLEIKEGKYLEVKHVIPLAPSGQLDAATLEKSNKKVKIVFTSARQQFSAELGGGEIFLKRRHLENRKTDELEHGNIGPVWFKLVLDVDSQAPSEWLDGRGRIATPAAVHHFKTALVNKSKHAESLAPGLRILSVDLGVRTFASCAVFELRKGAPQNRLAFLADADQNLWACHERSFLLTLPGEGTNAEVHAARRKAFDELGSLRRDIRRLKDMLRLSVKESCEERLAALTVLSQSILEESQRGCKTIFGNLALDPLKTILTCPMPVWQGEIKKQYHILEKILGMDVHNWRKHSRPRTFDVDDRKARRGYAPGKSAWAIDYLESVRKLLQSWSLHGREFGEIRRLNLDSHGTFAVRLLDHINAIKDDRIKSGSDLIIQAARGFLPDKGKGWVQRFEPCRMILFEDLARYLFRTDRSRRENSLLMRWSHREIIREATMQAEIYGISLDTVGAGFTSRFHARSGTPGIRIRVLAPEDFDTPTPSKTISQLAEQLGIDLGSLRPGVRVPWQGGEDFATLEAGGKLSVIHADINAAQNLQKRFWTRHADAYRLTAAEIRQNGISYWYPDRDGVRLRGALSTIVGGDGYARLVPADDGEGFVLEKVLKSRWAKAITDKAISGDESGLDEIEADIAEAADEENWEQGGRGTFFRDPSGFVLRADRWYESKVFWGRVQRRISVALGLNSEPF